jgi:3-dehydroquinate dehydratase/shikimate dehydrogenase
MIVVPSLLPRSNAEARRFLLELSGLPTPVELRIDGLRRPEPATLLSGSRPPVIVTCRSKKEGGQFSGTPGEAAAILGDAAAAGAEYIDAELSLGPGAIRVLLASAGRRRVILSFHDPDRTPSGLAQRFRKMASLRPAFVKIAVGARTFADTGKVLEILGEARKSRQPAVVLSMDGFGAYTRILQGPLGGRMTYAAFDPRRPTAPGQLSYAEMLDLYRVPALDRRTKVFGLLGNPIAVSSSRGVIVHNAAFRKAGVNAVYLNFASDDADEFMRIMGRRITGLSVTMPFKTAITRHLDVLEGSSALTGSVNTVVRRSGRLTGLNTDFHAFLALLRRRTAIAGKRLVVIGTGGTAATVAGAGALSGARVTIAGRRTSDARRLAERFGAEWIPLSALPSIGGDILVNATPVGMTRSGGRVARERIVAPSVLRGYRVVCDFANPPGEPTALVEDGTARGLKVITGRDIFDAQARLQSRIFLEAAGA